MKKIFLLFFIIIFISINYSYAKKIVAASVGEITAAIKSARPGDIIYIRGGIYKFTESINISNQGTVFEMIFLQGYPSDSIRPMFDFSLMKENSSNKGIILQTKYWHIKGIDIVNTGDNGMHIKRAHFNVVEYCTFSECADSGLQIDEGSSYNTIINCDSYNNADSKVENADGFACKMDVGTGNKFIGCRAWQNLDDGWDGYLRGANNIHTTFENCWAFRNGFLKDGTRSGGDGNGFKTGGSDNKKLKHHVIYKKCISAGNPEEGFDHNSNRGMVKLYNCSAHNNGKNLGFGKENPVSLLSIVNMALVGQPGKVYGKKTNIHDNCWQKNVTCDTSDFQSLDINQLSKSRKPDGSLPDITYLHLVKSSDLINAGVDIGIPFKGAAPDLGIFEYEEGTN